MNESKRKILDVGDVLGSLLISDLTEDANRHIHDAMNSLTKAVIAIEFDEPKDDEEDDGTLGPCGCVDYHVADCPTRTGSHDYWSDHEFREYEPNII